MGQISFLLTLIFISALVINRKNQFYAGGISALLLLKPQFILFAPIILVLTDKKAEFVKGFILGTLAFIGLNILIFGVNFITVYPAFVFHSEGLAYGTELEQNYNLISVFWALTKNMDLTYKLGYSLGFIIYAISLLVFYAKRNNLHALIGIILLIPLINVHTLTVDLCIYLIPLFGLAKLLKNRKPVLGSIYTLLWLTIWLGIYKIHYIATVILLAVGVFTLVHNRFTQEE